jgi:lysophospholipase L1-like esterase
VKKFKNFLLNVPFIFLGIFIALLIGEMVISFGHLAPEIAYIQKGRYRLSRNKKMGYEPTPGYKFKGDNLLFHDYRGEETNRLGFRDVDHSLRKAKGTFRILVLGDSISIGLYIKKYSETFPFLLEKNLLDKSKEVEVINMGVVGYNTLQEVEMLKERGLPFKPDLVLISYCLNDRERNDGNLFGTLLAAEVREKKVSRIRLHPFLTQSALYRFLFFRVFPEKIPDYKPERDQNYALLEKDTVDPSLFELSNLAQENDFQVLIAVWPEFTDLQEYKYLAEHKKIASLSDQYGFYFLDLLESIRNCASRSATGLSFDHYHPNESGNACAAKAMANFIEQRVLSKNP